MPSAAGIETKSRHAFPKSELPPGRRRVVTVGRREIVVVNSNGALYAVFNRCPHQQAPLDRGIVSGATVQPADAPVGTFAYAFEGRILRCPWHHYEFDLDNGSCLADPARMRIAVYEVREEGEEIALYV
jgi:3-phenylpropionate/trans-cinnamate dioxygenase ferredoxin subunit